MGFCSESLLLFAAFHPGTSANDCLGTFQWFGWRPWDQHQDGILWIFLGGSTTGVGLGVDEKTRDNSHPEIHCYYFYGLVTSTNVVILWANIKNCLISVLFWVDFSSLEDDAKKPTTCGLVNGWIPCLLRWGECHFSTGNTDDRATATGLGEMERLMEELRLVHWANVKLFQIWYIVTYGTEMWKN